MDYTKTPLWMKVRKIVRYTGLYGIRSTMARAKSQYHMRRRYERLPKERSGRASGRHIGILGCGNFAFATVAHYLRRHYGGVIRGVMDIDIHRAASLFDEYDADYYTDDAQRVIDDPDIDLIFIVSNHASHVDYATRALAKGKNVHVEKPQAVTVAQLTALCNAMRQSSGRVNLGFNRPHSSLTREVRRWLEGQEGPAFYSWFVVGHYLPPDHWYMRPGEGGRIVGNLCHWSDFLLHLIPEERRYPLTITPARSREPDNDVVVSYVFGDGTVASIGFTAKGHTFEGVRERFQGHRGDAIVSLVDFQRLDVEIVDVKHRRALRFRDHGHSSTIRRSYALVRGGEDAEAWPGCTVSYVWQTGLLYLETKRALDENRVLTINTGEPPVSRS
jgi:predicted dehydrogenase